MFIGGLDVGTTGCKLTVYDEKGNYIHNSYVEYDITRENGEHEVDANIIFAAVCKAIRDTADKYSLAAIGITTFGETFVALDENDNVLLPSMLYTDPRGEKECQALLDTLGEKTLIDISGVKPHQMYSLPKLMWIKNNRPDIYSKCRRVLLMEDYIVYKLTGVAQIDYSLAARTMAFDIRKLCWSDEIFASAGIDTAVMSAPVPTGTPAGYVLSDVADKLGLSEATVIVNGCHDQVAAAVGAGVFEVGASVDGTGTVECVTPVFDKIPENEKLYEEGYSVVPYVFEGTYVCYALSFTGGAVLKWYRDNFAKYEQTEAEKNGENVYAVLDSQIPDNPTGILVMPHFAGAANPYMDNDSRAVIAGLSLEHTNRDIYKALMEGVTYEILLNIKHLSSFGIELDRITATGGGASSPKWLQIKADILNRPVTVLEAKEVGACGTCMLTGVAIGVYKDLRDAANYFIKEKKTYLPSENAEEYKSYFERYEKLYDAVRPLIK
ncbi:MAG: carbohydrate kinase [Clostridia bacterium]|nr:carbohydrate kinase [Clostridia bacterium]